MTDNWRSIETVPKDGTEFQAWIINIDTQFDFWDPRCKFNDDGNFVTFGRIDYDIDGWEFQPQLLPTHWMSQPDKPEDLK